VVPAAVPAAEALGAELNLADLKNLPVLTAPALSVLSAFPCFVVFGGKGLNLFGGNGTVRVGA